MIQPKARAHTLLLTSTLAATTLALFACSPKTEGGADGGKASAGETAGKPDGGGSGGTTDPVPQGEPPKVVTPPGKLPVGESEVLPHEPGVVLGHVAVPSVSRLLRDVKPLVRDPMVSMYLDEATLKSFAKLGLGERGALADGLELTRPFGCAVLSPKKYDMQPAACVFGYTGGATKLIGDLKDEGKASDAAGHAAIYEIQGTKIYIDDLGGNDVAISLHDKVFAASSKYLKDDILARADKMHGDLEMVFYVADLYAEYKTEADMVFDEMEKAQSLGMADMKSLPSPELAAVATKWLEYNAASTKRSVQGIKDLDQLTLNFGVEDYGVFFGGSMHPKENSYYWNMVRSQGARGVDAAFVERLPASTIAIFAGVSSWDSLDLPEVKEVTGLLADTWAAATGGDRAVALAAIEGAQQQGKTLYTGESAMVFADTDKALFGVVSAMRLQAGQQATPVFREWMAAFTPEAALGKELSQYVTWSFTQDAATIGDVKVDRWTIKPGKKLEAELKKNLKDDDRKMIDKVWGPIELSIDRAEVGDAVLFAIAPKDVDGMMGQAINAQKGEGSLKGDAGLLEVMGRDQGAGLIMALDVRKTVAWIKSLEGASEWAKDIPDFGNNLSDLHAVAEYHKDGSLAGMAVVSRTYLEQVVDLVFAMQGGGM